jgi:molecular chaperone GrpE (heat shock protein)
MNAPVAPNLSKWPFYLGDLLLLAVAAWIVLQSPDPFRATPLFFLVFICVGAGGWLCVTPFLAEYRAAQKLAESDALTTTVAQIQNVHGVGEQIATATAQWQILQEQSAKTAAAAQEVAERMTAEAQAFADFMQKANDTEKGHLRLEVDKLRRSEGEWLQSVVRILDHVYALHQAGVRSGQPALMEQLGHFQSACREAVRRMGVVAFEASLDEPFNEKTHQLLDPEAKPPPHAQVAETIATGYTFQGQFLRCALVSVQPPAEDAADGGQIAFEEPS